MSSIEGTEADERRSEKLVQPLEAQHLSIQLGFMMRGSGFRVQGAGCRLQGSGFRVQGSASEPGVSEKASPLGIVAIK